MLLENISPSSNRQYIQRNDALFMHKIKQFPEQPLSVSLDFIPGETEDGVVDIMVILCISLQ